jgi:hypothetical protein
VDRRLEHWFKAQWRCQLDFYSTDALEKLGRLGLPGAQDGTWQVRAAAEAGTILGDRWSAFFKSGNRLLQRRVKPPPHQPFVNDLEILLCTATRSA